MLPEVYNEPIAADVSKEQRSKMLEVPSCSRQQLRGVLFREMNGYDPGPPRQLETGVGVVGLWLLGSLPAGT